MKMNLRGLVVVLALVLATVVNLVTGCSTTSPGAAGASTGTSAPQATLAGMPGKTGAQLWGERCGFCHNVRSPTSFSDAQWEVVMLHMRVRATLTAEEHKAILAFLKSAH